jgi:Xaa-Pro aminopeptidase
MMKRGTMRWGVTGPCGSLRSQPTAERNLGAARSPLAFTLALLAVAAANLPVGATKVAAQEPDPAGATPARQQPAVEHLFDWTSLQFPAEEYARRREAVIRALRDSGGGGLLVLSAHGLSHGETFRQADDFLYLTGLELPSSALFLDTENGSTTLFLPRGDFRFESATRPNDFPGRPLADDPTIAERSGIAVVLPIAELDRLLVSWADGRRTLRFNPGRPGQIRRVETSLIPDWDPLLLSLYHLQYAYPELRIENAHTEIARVRMVKSPAEIEALRRSAALTQEAIREAAGSIREGVTERELEAVFEAACKERGAQRVAFSPIIKSGPNSLWPWRILAAHYDRRNRAMVDGDLVIFDVGCELDHYVSDVGRTFPVSGSFSTEQATILAMEIAVADAIIAAVRPGITFGQLRAVAESVIHPEHRPYMQTGLFFGHHLGLSTGDPSLPDTPLAPGMVFTVEPWYYNHDRGISVFTEDEVLVTEDGADLLTAGLSRRIADLERMVGARR